MPLGKQSFYIGFTYISRKRSGNQQKNNQNDFFMFFLGGGGVCKTKNFPDRCGAGEILEKIPSVGEVWIFSGTTDIYADACKDIYVCQYKAKISNELLEYIE